MRQNILNNQKSPRGFTIIEVLFALAVFSLGFFAVGVMQTKGINSARGSREKTEALNIAETQSERLMAMKFYLDDNGEDDDGDGETDFYDLNPGLAAGSFSDNTDWTGKYRVYWKIVDDAPLPALKGLAPFPLTRSKTITLWVTPDERPGKTLINFQFVKVGVSKT
ncbi:MAG: prepilin-type N-terminal cleavage/methylation domain-containing protein [Desulfobacterales bacterium]|jgi:prepilin-type N-terminal cleavage/methylation domain-containing protein|nr:prepilin-type N-terminal cleavage/methylation domain-containing protein [Desulfobacterales bacterium]